MKTPDEILAILRADMQAAKERGLSFISGSFGLKQVRCCAISAGYTGEGGGYVQEAADRFGVPREAIWDIVNGYDGEAIEPSSEYECIGAALRAEFPPQPNPTPTL